MTIPKLSRTRHRRIDVDGAGIFYRESVPVDAGADPPMMLLLHGFPSASHQFRRLIDVLGAHYRLIAPDYPGFGHSDAPDSATIGGGFTYTFDHLTEVIEGLVERLGLTRIVLYMFDFGAPVGLRLAVRHPEWVKGLVVQNGNAYQEGLSPAARHFIALGRSKDGSEAAIREMLNLPATRSQYEAGAHDAQLVAPDGWTLDQHFLDLPGRHQPQLDRAFDYKTNLDRYPQWQAWLRQHTPPTLIVWGRNDPFFPEAGARAFLRDLPDAELHLFDTGHFALEERLPDIAPLIADFLERTCR